MPWVRGRPSEVEWPSGLFSPWSTSAVSSETVLATFSAHLGGGLSVRYHAHGPDGLAVVGGPVELQTWSRRGSVPYRSSMAEPSGPFPEPGRPGRGSVGVLVLLFLCAFTVAMAATRLRLDLLSGQGRCDDAGVVLVQGDQIQVLTRIVDDTDLQCVAVG